jgi:hypothetical protein
MYTADNNVLPHFLSFTERKLHVVILNARYVGNMFKDIKTDNLKQFHPTGRPQATSTLTPPVTRQVSLFINLLLISSSSSFPFPFVPLQRRGCLVAPLFLWIVSVPCPVQVISPATGVESEYDRVSNRDRLKLTPDLTTGWAKGNDIVVYSSLWGFKSFLHAVKSYDMGPSRFTSHPRWRCGADFYRP